MPIVPQVRKGFANAHRLDICRGIVNGSWGRGSGVVVANGADQLFRKVPHFDECRRDIGMVDLEVLLLGGVKAHGSHVASMLEDLSIAVAKGLRQNKNAHVLEQSQDESRISRQLESPLSEYRRDGSN